MTTLVAINTRDAVVMGTDSLGTVTRSLVDPNDLAEYFETGNGSKIKVGPDGKPFLDEMSKIFQRCREVPYNNVANMDKLHSLSPLEMGVMTSGPAALGDRSIKSLIGEFRNTDKVFQSKELNYSLQSIGERLLAFLWGYYHQQYPDERLRPELELILCGYDKEKYTPGVVRIYVNENQIRETDYDYCLILGGQTREIQRLVFGTDAYNKSQLMGRSDSLLNKYHELLSREIEASGLPVTLKRPEEFRDELKLFHGWDFEGLSANWSALSEQNAIECVDFLVKLMIDSQRFSTQIPSVGGEVQIAVITKASGFTFVSKREWRHGDCTVPARE